MDAIRCTDCGDVRWSILGIGANNETLPCELCGGTTTPERRQPNRCVEDLAEERRDRVES
jgi:hypothetical protein